MNLINCWITVFIYVIKTFLTALWNRCGNIIVLCSFLMIFAKMAIVIYLMIWHFIYNNIFFLSFWILSRIDSKTGFIFQNIWNFKWTILTDNTLITMRFIIVFFFYNIVKSNYTNCKACNGIIDNKSERSRRIMNYRNQTVTEQKNNLNYLFLTGFLKFHMFWKIKPVLLQSFTYSLSDKFNTVAYSNL
jgi:hypothetical protein